MRHATYRSIPIFVTVLLVLLIVPNLGYAAPGTKARVISVRGTVEFFSRAFAQRGWRPAVSGQVLYAGDQLRTGADSGARVTVYRDSGEDTIDIAQETLLAVYYSGDAGRTDAGITGILLDLKSQFVRWWNSDEPPPMSPFNVRTPTVTLGTRDGFSRAESGGAYWQYTFRAKEPYVLGQPPAVINICETNDVGHFCAKWTWADGAYEGRWDNGATARLRLDLYDGLYMVVTRHDKAGPSKGLKAVYEGNVSGKTVRGVAGWNLERWKPQTKRGTWEGSWEP